MAIGTSWEFKGSCSPRPGVVISIAANSRVTRAERVHVAGADVDTWAVRSEGTLTFQAPDGTSDQKITADERFSPQHGLSVRSIETIEGTDPSTGEHIKESTQREILNLSPS
jgi:hypothetical protein